MKTSDKLLMGLFLGLIVAMFGAAVSLRHQYDSIDKRDPYARWKKQPLAPFRVVQVSGPNTADRVQVELGSSPRLLTDTLLNRELTGYTARVERDTLFVRLQSRNGSYFGDLSDDINWENPVFVIQSPKLTEVRADGVFCQLRNINGDSLQLWQGGKGGRMMLDKVRVNQLTATVTQKNQLIFYKAANDIRRATIVVRDSARLAQYGSFKEGLTLTADPGTNVRLMGKDLQHIRQAGR